MQDHLDEAPEKFNKYMRVVVDVKTAEIYRAENAVQPLPFTEKELIEFVKSTLFQVYSSLTVGVVIAVRTLLLTLVM